MGRANARFASRCGGKTSNQLRRCATRAKTCTLTRSNRRFAAANARTSHARALLARRPIFSAHAWYSRLR
eukprot:10043290-Lingulodinium_polyedra.AAC.1